MSAYQIPTEPETPCERFACSLRETCHREKLACTAFLNYVQTGRVAHPHINFEEGKRHESIGSVTPTRDIYEMSMRQC